jgi:hypothetical protein
MYPASRDHRGSDAEWLANRVITIMVVVGAVVIAVIVIVIILVIEIPIIVALGIMAVALVEVIIIFWVGNNSRSMIVFVVCYINGHMV